MQLDLRKNKCVGPVKNQGGVSVTLPIFIDMIFMSFIILHYEFSAEVAGLSLPSDP